MPLRLKALLSILLIAALSSLQSGCTRAPVQEMSNARQAIQAARAVGAERLSPGLLRHAMELLERARKQLEIGEYRRARRNAVQARREALRAREKALSSGAPPQRP